MIVLSPWEVEYKNPDTDYWAICENCRLPWGMHPDCLDPKCPLLTRHCHQIPLESKAIVRWMKP